MIKYEKADMADISVLTELRLAYLTEDHGGLTEAETQKIASQLPLYYSEHLDKDLFVYVCRADGKIVSCVFLYVSHKPPNPDFINGRTGTVLNVYTLPDHRRRGIAGRLMQDMLDDAKAMGLDYVELKATDMGRGLYKSLGFKDVVSKYHSMKYVL